MAEMPLCIGVRYQQNNVSCLSTYLELRTNKKRWTMSIGCFDECKRTGCPNYGHDVPPFPDCPERSTEEVKEYKEHVLRILLKGMPLTPATPETTLHSPHYEVTICVGDVGMAVVTIDTETYEELINRGKRIYSRKTDKPSSG